MRIGKLYSHLNGLEWLECHREGMLQEIEAIIASVDAGALRTKISKEKKMKGRALLSPTQLNKAFDASFKEAGWNSQPNSKYYVCEDAETNLELAGLNMKAQKELIESRGFEAIQTLNKADFEKERVSVEIQFGKYAFVQFDIFIKHAANYMKNKIDLGVEIVPMKSMEKEMSSGPSYFEKNLHEILRQGRIFPPVPLILIGVEP